MPRWIGIMKAYPYEERRLIDKKFNWQWPVIIQPKLDGERCRALRDSDSGEWVLLSSEQNQILSVPHINHQLKSLDLDPEIQELDGELYCHRMPREEIHSIVSRKKALHRNYLSISYDIFDLISEHHQTHRLGILEKIVDAPEYMNVSNIFVVTSAMVYSLEEIKRRYKTLVDLGYEGIIIRHPLAYYERKRSNKVMKFKPKQEDTYIICGLNEAIDKHGIPKATLGAFIVHPESDPDGIFSVGAGELDHAERKRLWEEGPEVIGRKLRVRYQTKSKKGCPLFAIAKEVI